MGTRGAGRIFSTKVFGRFASHEGILDDDLCEAIARAEAGQIDADLGGGVIKQRIARRGRGKSGGFRTIILFRRETMAVFVYGFAKSDRDNIRPDELKAFRQLAAAMLSLGDAALAAATRNGTLREIECHG
ncbi:MAG: type II toxin-antitoxin system RelE/ParE family toxin [Rhodospirillales bacterium]|nr:type II toxin-antitoxin system RelE/ParE family toxin [Rhodospirillales bacterium]